MIRRRVTLYDPVTGEIDAVLYNVSEGAILMHINRQKLLHGKTLNFIEGEHDYHTHKINVQTRKSQQRGTPVNRGEFKVDARFHRQMEYPPLQEQIDALAEGGDKLAQLKAKIAAVDAKYPLGE